MPRKKKSLARKTPGNRRPSRSSRPQPPEAKETRPPVVALYRERQKMRDRVARDRARRYADFLEQVNNPTEPPCKGKALRTMTVRAGTEALRILAEGDSWFDYPLPWPQGDGVIVQLQALLGYSIANMAHYGLEVDQMMGLSLRQEIISKLNDPNIRYDAMLFSGGGNDLAGDRFCIWLKDSSPVVAPANMINTVALNAEMAVLEAEYRELIDLRNQYSPQTVIFVHSYDFPPITGIGVCGAGPWLKPSLDYCYQHLGITNPDPNVEFVVVQTILKQFNAMLNAIATDPDVQNFILVPTQGTLTANNTDWQNELHPSTSGFIKIAKQFQQSLTDAFP